MDILIPSLKKREELEDLINEITNSLPEVPCNIITSGFPVSASTNRNYTLLQAEENQIVVMMDDDMTGFYPGWLQELLSPFEADPSVVMVSARLLKADGSPNIMLGGNYNLDDSLVEVEFKQLPTACIAFKNEHIRFNENFVGSGFEDNRFCHVMGMVHPAGKFVINNKVQLVHLNEMKNQGGENWVLNEAYYKKTIGQPIKVGPYVV